MNLVKSQSLDKKEVILLEVYLQIFQALQPITRSNKSMFNENFNAINTFWTNVIYE